MDDFDLEKVPTLFSLNRKHKELKDSMMEENTHLYHHGEMAHSVKILSKLVAKVAKERKAKEINKE